jgi:predicted MFS family arabinose efflux permease
MAAQGKETQEKTSERPSGEAAPYRIIGLLAAVQLLQGAGEASVSSFFNVYLDDYLRIATRQIGTVTAVGQLLAAPAALVAPTLIERWGNRRTFVMTSCAMVVCMLPLVLVPSLWAAGLGFLGIIALASVWRPAIMVIRMELVSPEWWPVVNGASHMASGLSYSAIAFGGGHIITTVGYSSLFATGAAVSTVGILLFWMLFRESRGRPTHSP